MAAQDENEPNLQSTVSDLLKQIGCRPVYDQDILSLVDVCALLHCTEDTIRRVPDEDLPAYRVGRKNLYFREDVLRFVRSKRVRKTYENPQNSAKYTHRNDVDDLIQDMLNSDQVDDWKSSVRNTS